MSTGFDPVNMFWKMMLNVQEMNQLALKLFLNTQKIQQSQQSVEQLMQECMVCVGDNTSMGLSMLQSLGKAKNPEEFIKAQEQVIAECGEKNLGHAKKIMNIYHNIWQDTYNYAKENVSDFTGKFTEAASTISSKITENASKFAETISKSAGGGSSNKKQHGSDNTN